MSIAWAFVWNQIKGNIQEFNFESLTYYAVSNPNSAFDKSYFCRESEADDPYKCVGDEETELNKNTFYYDLMFQNCTKFGATNIGVVYAKKGDDGVTDADMANKLLDMIFENITTTYYNNNE